MPSVVYSTVPAATTVIVTTTMVTTGGSGGLYRFSYYFDIVTAGSSCSTLSSLVVQVLYQDPNAAGAETIVGPTNNFQTNNATVGDNLNGSATGGSFVTPYSFVFRAKASTNIQYNTVYNTGTGCSPPPKYQLYPVLEQLE